MIVPFFALVNPQAVTVYWYVARASGFVLYLLLTLSIVLGLLMAIRWRSDAWPRFVTEELHRYILLVAATFLVVHVVSTLLDSFIHFSVLQVLIPFTASYRTVWMTLGIVSMYLAIALFLSFYVRRYIGYKAWRTMHYAGSAAWILALAHSITTGSDTRAPWALAIYGGSAVIVALLLAIRFGGLPVPFGDRQPFRPRVLWSLAGVLLVGVALTESGPLAAHWASRAGGAPSVAVSAPLTSPSLLPTGFSARVTGTSSQQNPSQLQPGTVLVHLRLRGSGADPVALSYGLLLAPTNGGAQFIRGVFSLSPSTLAWNCAGSATYQAPDLLQSTCSLPGHSSMHISTRFRLDSSGNVSGQVTAT